MGQDATPGIPGGPASSPAIPGTPVPGAPSSPSGQTQGGWSNPPSNPLADSPPGAPTPGLSTPLPVTPAAGGKFSIVPDKLTAEIQKWEQLLEDLKVDYKIGIRMTVIKSPGCPSKDSISPPYIDKANASGRAFLEHNMAMQNFTVGYIKKMKAALAEHVRTEQANVDAMKRQQGKL
jgi:hypothetical protein